MSKNGGKGSILEGIEILFRVEIRKFLFLHEAS